MPLDVNRLREAAQKKRSRPPLSHAKIRDAERAIGFALPPSVRRIYAEVGDGSFGPGYGFYGLSDGTEFFPKESVAYLYSLFRKGDPEDPSFAWPHMLLPIVDWGCAIRSCVDCSMPSLPMVRHDPNVEVDQFRPEGWHFEEWLQAWLDGYDLWKNEDAG